MILTKGILRNIPSVSLKNDWGTTVEKKNPKRMIDPRMINTPRPGRYTTWLLEMGMLIGIILSRNSTPDQMIKAVIYNGATSTRPLIK